MGSDRGPQGAGIAEHNLTLEVTRVMVQLAQRDSSDRAGQLQLPVRHRAVAKNKKRVLGVMR